MNVVVDDEGNEQVGVEQLTWVLSVVIFERPDVVVGDDASYPSDG